MSKVTISPLLTSLFRSSDRMTKDEANTLQASLSNEGGEDVRITIAQSTVAKNRKANYITAHGEVGDAELARVLEDCGWEITESVDRGINEGFWIYFLRK